MKLTLIQLLKYAYDENIRNKAYTNEQQTCTVLFNNTGQAYVDYSKINSLDLFVVADDKGVI